MILPRSLIKQRGFITPPFFAVFQRRIVPTDSDWANVVLLLGNDDAANGTTTFTDQSASAHSMTRGGGVVYSSAQAATGMTTSIALDGSGDSLSTALGADFQFAGDFTIEAYVRLASLAENSIVWQWNTFAPALYIDTLGRLSIYSGAQTVLNTSALSTNTWYHVAFVRSGTTLHAYKDGTAGTGTTYSATTSNSGTGYIGTDTGGQDLNGFINSLRITKGVARYTATFTPPALPLPSAG